MIRFLSMNRLNTIGPVTVWLVIILGSPVGIRASSKQPELLTLSIQIPDQDAEWHSSGPHRRVTMAGYGVLNEPGVPELPARIVAVALPPGAVVQSLTVTPAHVDTVSGIPVDPVEPVRSPGQSSSGFPDALQTRYETNRRSIYGSDAPYPVAVARIARAGSYRRYTTVDIHVTPCQYQPVSQILQIARDITLNIQYHIPEPVPVESIPPESPAVERRAHQLLLNYADTRQWYPQGSHPESVADYVIITPPDLAGSIASLSAWETLRGRSVQTVTTDWIASQYSGYDLAEKMRNFLRDKYPVSEWGITDVCLVGAMAEVPMRHIVDDPDTDFYFAELSLPDSASWDANGDHSYLGTGDSCDYYAEVNVGRIPWSDPGTVQHICDKSVAFECTHDPAYKRQMMVLGSFLSPQTDTAVTMEMMIDQPGMNGWSVTRMYEQNIDYTSTYPCDYALDHDSVMAVWPVEPYAFVSYAGHGTAGSAHILGLGGDEFINAYDTNDLNDDTPSIVFALACSNSHTQTVSLGASMLKQGAVGFVGATRNAYFRPAWAGPQDGSTQTFSYFFSQHLTSLEHSQGSAHQAALQDVYLMNGWTNDALEICEWTLYGNPTLGLDVSITRDGVVAFGAAAYSPVSVVDAFVRDLDLNSDPMNAETTEVTLTANSGDAEVLLLTETGPDTGEFAGIISAQSADPEPGNGMLEVMHGNTVTVVYIDADNGQGGTGIEKTDSADIDGVAPVITGVTVGSVSDTQAVITWTTDEPATSRVMYGLGSPSMACASESWVTDHLLTLSDLQDCSQYCFYVVSTDIAGNVAVDDNGGENYSFITWERVCIMMETMDSNPQWSTQGLWEWGQPTGQGGQYGAPDPTGGYSGSTVYGYNLNGNYPNSMPETLYLTTDSIDCSETDTVTLDFWCWLGIEQITFDQACIDISGNGGTTWHHVWSNGLTVLEGGDWEYWTFDISGVAAGSSDVRIRWGMGPTDYIYGYCGWNIDDVRIHYAQPCTSPDPTPTPACIHSGDPTGDGEITAGDAQMTFLIALG
ncbi:hypothetical protein JXA80_14525, partial [bacterium]|nr:hypothetical protein [candidate division CSSED10-310 bacterium]